MLNGPIITVGVGHGDQLYLCVSIVRVKVISCLSVGN